MNTSDWRPLWQIGNCDECGGAIYSQDVTGRTLPVSGKLHSWCREKLLAAQQNCSRRAALRK